MNIIPLSLLVISNILSKIWLFLFVAGRSKSFEFSATFLKSSTLKVSGISSSWYKSQITCPFANSNSVRLRVPWETGVTLILVILKVPTMELLYAIWIISSVVCAVKNTEINPADKAVIVCTCEPMIVEVLPLYTLRYAWPVAVLSIWAIKV